MTLPVCCYGDGCYGTMDTTTLSTMVHVYCEVNVGLIVPV